MALHQHTEKFLFPPGDQLRVSVSSNYCLVAAIAIYLPQRSPVQMVLHFDTQYFGWGHSWRRSTVSLVAIWLQLLDLQDNFLGFVPVPAAQTEAAAAKQEDKAAEEEQSSHNTSHDDQQHGECS